MFGIACRIISNICNTPITKYHKDKAGIAVIQAADEKRVQGLEAEAEAWNQRFGTIYGRRTEEKPPLPSISQG